MGADGRVLVAVGEPPERGKANAAVVAVLAGALGVRPAAISIRAGVTGRTKQVRISGLTSEELASVVALLRPNVPR